jgi:uncharacterized protein YkwD
VNQARKSHGLNELKLDPRMTAATEEIIHNQTVAGLPLTHDGHNEIFQAHGLWYWSGANMAWGYGMTPQATFNVWMNSDGHRAHILRSGFTFGAGGCLAVTAGTSGPHYWAFGAGRA